MRAWPAVVPSFFCPSCVMYLPAHLQQQGTGTVDGVVGGGACLGDRLCGANSTTGGGHRTVGAMLVYPGEPDCWINYNYKLNP